MANPCTCGHQRNEHRDGRHRCLGLDSYGIECDCPSYEADGISWRDAAFRSPDWPDDDPD